MLPSRRRPALLVALLALALPGAGALGVLLPAPTSAAADSGAAVATASATAAVGTIAATAAAEPPADAVWVSPGGSSDGAGTKSSPLADPAEAVSRAGEGGTVVLRGGTYDVQNLVLDQAGLTLTSAPGEEAVLEGADAVPAASWTQDGSVWTAQVGTDMCASCTVNPDAAAEGMAAHPEQVVVAGSVLIQVAGRDEVTEGTFTVEGSSAGPVYVLGSDPAGADVLVSTRTRAIAVTAEDVTIRGVTVRDYAPVQAWGEDDGVHGDATGPAAVIVSAEGATLEGDTVTRTSGGIALHVGAAGATVRATSVVDNGGTGVNANQADGLLLDHVLIGRSNTAGYLTTDCSAYCTVAMLKTTHTEGVTLRSSVLDADATGPAETAVGVATATEAAIRTTDRLPGFWCDEGCVRSVVVANEFRSVPQAIIEEVSSEAVLASNLIEGSGTGILVSGSDRVRIWNNTLTGTWRPVFVREDPRTRGCQDSMDAAAAASASAAPATATTGSGGCSRVDEWSVDHGLSWDTSGTEIANNIISSRPVVDDASLINDVPALVAVKEGLNADGSSVASADVVRLLDSNAYYRSSLDNDPDVLRWDARVRSGGQQALLEHVADVASSDVVPTAVEGREAHGIEGLGSTRSNPYLRDEAGGDLRTDPDGPAATGGTALTDEVATALSDAGSDVTAGESPARGALVNVAWEDGIRTGAPGEAPSVTGGGSRSAVIAGGAAVAIVLGAAVGGVVIVRRRRRG